jgi:hypothetical protein
LAKVTIILLYCIYKYTIAIDWYCQLQIFSVQSVEAIAILEPMFDRLCGLVVKVPGYRSTGPGSILGAIRFSEK